MIAYKVVLNSDGDAGFGPTGDKVTHWMPMPDPPSEDA